MLRNDLTTTKCRDQLIQLIQLITEVQFEDLQTKIPRKLHSLWKKCPWRHTTNTVNASEGSLNLSRTEGFLRNFHWIIQHCLPDTLHHRRRKGHVVSPKLSKVVRTCERARDICQAAEENRTYNEAYQRLQQEVENSEEPKTSQCREGETKEMICSERWFSGQWSGKKWCFSMVFSWNVLQICRQSHLGCIVAKLIFESLTPNSRKQWRLDARLGGAHILTGE